MAEQRLGAGGPPGLALPLGKAVDRLAPRRVLVGVLYEDSCRGGNKSWYQCGLPHVGVSKRNVCDLFRLFAVTRLA